MLTLKISYPPLLTADVAQLILNGVSRVSLDLGLSKMEPKFDGNEIILKDNYRVSIEKLKKITDKDDAIFFPQDSELFMVATSNSHYYKLVTTSGAPTIEIDGIRMHRTKDTTPEEDAKKKINILGVNEGKILDTCTGLGYTAIESLHKNAEIVVTIEKDYNVTMINNLNPWSRDLFDERIHKIFSDSYHAVDCLPKNFFEYIIHDPPRFSFAGQLYSEAFYSKLFSRIKHGGKLLHYTGEPGSRYRKKDLQKGVQSRLKSVGFKKLTYHPEIMAITCER
ncbi:SAM-dependent methyltransferase [Candidatus Bathyarchaeota archaeon]|nr:SAM-dependent methyltransferase [Candidatus Bathyarchaeota archaeon]